MKKNKMLKVLAVPMMAGVLLFSNTSGFLGGEDAVYAAVTKEQQFNAYAKDVLSIMDEMEKIMGEEEDELSEQDIKDFLYYVDNQYKNEAKITKLYGSELGKIHKNLDASIKIIYDMYDLIAKIAEEESKANANEELIEEWSWEMIGMFFTFEEEITEYSEAYTNGLESYIKKYNIKVDEKIEEELDIDVEQTKPTTNDSTTINYKVKKNDTLYSIAKAHNTTVNEIKKLNNLKSNEIKVGKTLKVKKNTVTTNKPSTNTNSNVKTYTVKSGDSLSKIAKTQGTTVAQLKKSNNLKDDVIRPGQKLKIEKPKTTTTKPSTNTNTSSKVKTYTVKKGDYLSTIAKSQGTTVAQLKKSNGLKDDVIRPGQKLKIEKPTTTTTKPSTTTSIDKNTYTVKKNDTLYSIAKKNNTTVAKLKKLNNLKSDKIAVGKKLKVK